jgi:hypothetical protein
MLAGSIPYTKLVGSDIVTVGTVSTGTWQATPIASTYIAATGAVVGTYGDATHVPRVSVNAAGQITSVSSVAITGGGAGGIPGGTSGQMQVNIAGAFAGTSGATATATVVTLISPIVSGCIKDLSAACVITMNGSGGVTVGTGANLFTFDTSAITALRTIKVPNADSVTVVGGAAVSNQFVTAISASTGVISRLQPAFNMLAGSISMSQIAGGVGGGASASTCLHGDNTWATCGTGGGSTSPGGSNTQLQYNVGGTGFGGITGATTDGTSVTFASTNLIATRPKITTGIADSANNLVIVMPGDGTVQLGTGANSLAFDTSGFTGARTVTVQDSDGIAALMSGTPTNDYCAKWAVSGGIYKLVAASGTCSTGGSVTSVAATVTGGIIAVAGTPVTTTGTLAFTVAGTSGGIPYFNTAASWASSGALTNHGVVIGGGAGGAPTSTAAGSAGQVLTSNGSSANPTFQDNAGGGSATPCTTTALSLQRNNAGALGCVSLVTSTGTYLAAAAGGIRAADIVDANGNPSLILAATASAVNGLTLTNAAAANPATVVLATTGSSTNINLELLPKGSGNVQVGAACASGSSGVQCAGIGQFGVIKQDGIDTGTISFLTQSGGGTYNWNWPTTAGTAGYTLSSQGGGSSAMVWVPNVRSCTFENDTQSATALTDAQITGHQCQVPANATLVEITVSASGGVPSVTVERYRPSDGSQADLVSGALATGTSGAVACAFTSTGATCPITNKTSSGSITISNTSLTKGDFIRVKSATAGGVATWQAVTAHFTIN